MNNLSNTAKKLDKVLEIAHIVLGALAIACIVGVALIAVAYILRLDPEIIGTATAILTLVFWSWRSRKPTRLTNGWYCCRGPSHCLLAAAWPMTAAGASAMFGRSCIP